MTANTSYSTTKITTSPSYEWLFFDWDGCIADSLASWVTICQQALSRQNITASRHQVWEGYRLGNTPKHFEVEDMVQWKKDVGLLGCQEFPLVSLNDGAAETLTVLAATKHLAVISDSRQDFIAKPLERHHLQRYFELVITGENVPAPKPHPAGINQALAFFGATPRRSVMIGDSAKDLEAAANAGIDSILYYPAHNHSRYDLEDLQKYNPAYIVKSFQELTKLLVQL